MPTEVEQQEIKKISDIVSEKAPLLKEQFNVPPYAKRDKRREKEPPEYTPVYRRTVELREGIRPHAEDDFFPHKIFSKKAPNEKEEEFAYRHHLFSIIGASTHPYWSNALNKVNRIWNEKNYSVIYPEIKGALYETYPAKQYFEEKYPKYVSIESQFQSILTAKKLSDPNSWAVVDVVPDEDETNLPEPYVRFYPSQLIIGFQEKEYLLCLTAEKSMVKMGDGKEKKEGLVLRYYDRTGIYSIKQVGKKIDYKFGDPELVFANAHDELFADRLKGTPVSGDGDDEYIYYESYFQPAIPALNEAILDTSNQQISKMNSAYPERWEYVDDCNEPACEGGWIYSEDRANKNQCNSCHGTGKKNWSSPMSVWQVLAPKEGSPLNVDTSKLQMPPFGYVAKQGEIVPLLEFLRKEIKNACVEAFVMLNIDVSNSNVKGSETALGKQIDREEFFSFLLKFSAEIFDLLKFMINGIGKFRYGAAWESVTIGYPQNFKIRNDFEITEEMTKAKESGMPPVVINHMMREYITTRFNSQADVEKMSEFIFKVDRLAAMNNMDITAALSVGTVAKWEKILHDSISYFIEQATRENEGFWQMEFEQQSNIITGYAQAKAAELTPDRVNIEDIIKQVEVAE